MAYKFFIIGLVLFCLQAPLAAQAQTYTLIEDQTLDFGTVAMRRIHSGATISVNTANVVNYDPTAFIVLDDPKRGEYRIEDFPGGPLTVNLTVGNATLSNAGNPTFSLVTNVSNTVEIDADGKGSFYIGGTLTVNGAGVYESGDYSDTIDITISY